jgi:hypothetical protein
MASSAFYSTDVRILKHRKYNFRAEETRIMSRTAPTHQYPAVA